MAAVLKDQIPLKVNFASEATFDNFVCESDASRQTVEFLHRAIESDTSQHAILWGTHGSGLTHCLNAVCNKAKQQGLRFAYLPLAEFSAYPAKDVCQGLEALDIVCLGGIDYICGIQAWEEQIFHLYNNLKDANKTLIVSSYTSPTMLPIVLPDLKSRLLGAHRHRLTALTDQAKVSAMIARAAQKGIDMSEDLANYLLRHTHRGSRELFNTLERLDESQLSAKRKLTKPFIKEVLSL